MDTQAKSFPSFRQNSWVSLYIYTPGTAPIETALNPLNFSPKKFHAPFLPGSYPQKRTLFRVYYTKKAESESVYILLGLPQR